MGDEVHGKDRRPRETHGWSQETLVRKLHELTGVNLHSTAMTKIERSSNRPAMRLNEAAALALVLGIDLRHFTSPRDEIRDDAEYHRVPSEYDRLIGERDELERDLEDRRLAIDSTNPGSHAEVAVRDRLRTWTRTARPGALSMRA